MTLALGATFISVSQLQADDWKEISFADPTIFVENGKYYLTGTRNQEPLGFSILESTDLEHWTVPDGSSQQLILRKGDRTYGEKASGHLNILRRKEPIISLIQPMSKR